MKSFFEPGPGLSSALKDFKISPASVAAAVASIIFGVTGAFVLFANVASGAGLSVTQTVSWIMAGNIVSCVSTILLALYYKQPIVIMPSLTALLFMATMFSQFSINEISAGYIMSAAIVLLIGVLGIIGKIEKILPLPIVMAMIAGTFISYGPKMINGVIEQPVVGALIIGSYLFAHLSIKRIPPLLIAIIIGAIGCFFLIPFSIDTSSVGFVLPTFAIPSFNMRVFLSMTIPMALIVLSGFWRGNGVLIANGYAPPLNTIVKVSGIAAMIGAFFTGHAINVAGPMVAIVGGEEAGDQKNRYVASVLGTAGLLLTGIFAGFILPVVLAFPTSVSNIFAGLALIRLFTSSLEIAFGSKRFLMGAFTAFIVGMSGFSAFEIGAAVWALFFGIIVSFFTERECFRGNNAGSDK